MNTTSVEPSTSRRKSGKHQNSQTVSTSPVPVTSSAIPGNPWISAQLISSPLPPHNARRTRRLPHNHRIPSIDRAIQYHRPLHLAPPRRFRGPKSVRAGRIHALLIPPVSSSNEKLLDRLEPLLSKHPLSIYTDELPGAASRTTKIDFSGEVRVEDDLEERVRDRVEEEGEAEVGVGEEVGICCGGSERWRGRGERRT